MNGKLHCKRCDTYFYSRKYIETGRKPVQCPRCKNPNWDNPRKNRRKQ